jgi:transcriptional regulator GlxA family with amidase domain
MTHPDALDPRIARALKILNHTEYRGTVPYGSLRQACSLSRVQIDRLFQESLHRTPREYLEERILEKVSDALRGTTFSVKEIAFAQGFATPSHFGHWFRSRSGMTPGEYRKNARGGI